MRLLTSVAVLGVAALTARAETPAKPIALFDGKTLDGWSLVADPATPIAQVCHITPDATMAVGGTPAGYLLAEGHFSNYRLHVEWRWPAHAKKNSNSGILLHISSGPVYQKRWPVCLQVQMKLNHAGDLLPMGAFTFAEPLSTAAGAATPQRNMQRPPSEKPLGEWDTCDVVCRDGTIECTVNGVFQNKVTGCQPASGQIGLQLEGTPYELRHVTVTPLD